MVIKTLDAQIIRKCFLAGASGIEAKKEYINDLNVFPVPDGDTGTNMTMTIMSAVREVSALEEFSMKELAKAISSGSLRGARGNSGVILSQLLRGFTKEIAEKEAVDVPTMAAAFEKAVESAYRAVMKPKEGTILTVARGGAEKAAELVGRTDDLVEFSRKVLDHMRVVLDGTPELLPVLKEAGVVDSGGEGLVTILETAYDVMIGKEIDLTVVESAKGSPVQSATVTDSDAGADIKFGYCTEFIIMLEKAFHEKDEKEFKSYLESIGDSIVCVADDDIVKIHVHTNDPGLAIQKALTYGSLTKMKIDNMREEHNEKVIRDAEKEAQRQKKEEPRKEVGFISVSAGEGLSEIFTGLGVDYVIEGGQTMNPSTEDILAAIAKVNADTIYVLPNNGNIILASEQARDLTKDKSIVVVPSKNIPQGISAIINFMPGVDPEENLENMVEGMAYLKAGQVTYAVRDTSLDGKEIKQGDIMGLSDKTIEAVGNDIVSTTVELAQKLMDEDSELVTLYYGDEADEEQANKIAEELQKIDEDIEVEVHYGGQPIYYYFISVE